MPDIDNTNELNVLMEKMDKEHHPQHICNYLLDLRERLKQTVQQHTDLIQISMNIIKEMGDVSTMLTLSQSGPGLQANKIKRLIMEFENMQTTGDTSQGLTSKDVMDLNALVTDFRRLDESQLLRDSLMCFKRAKESFEKVESLLSKFGTSCSSANPSPQDSRVSLCSRSDSLSLREKIQAFNKAFEQGQNPMQNFTSCFSSISNTNVPTRDDTIKPVANGSRSRTNSGYEGDVDSEVDQANNVNIN